MWVLVSPIASMLNLCSLTIIKETKSEEVSFDVPSHMHMFKSAAIMKTNKLQRHLTSESRAGVHADVGVY